MFDRYTEKARRVIFFARYEASHFGSPYIETEHLLLGVLREDKWISTRAIPNLDVESIQQEIEKATLNRKSIPTSVDLPLSNECKRVLAYAEEEAVRLNHNHIGSEHLFLGLLREDSCFGAGLLKERGVTLEAARSIVGRTAEGSPDSGMGVGTAGQERLFAESRVVMRRSIVFQDEADGTNCGETFSIDVPRVGDEIKTPQIRGRVTRVIYAYEQADYEINGQKANLKPEKIVVNVQLLKE
ncbi:MAG: hypothetical protein DMG60_04790 [Acidobacteria bacterium]|jgi:ATP-dependent Clp protease ATP-binding subunit ClpA|nr:MAG: hypothetical protein DMG60_04790 [Acidobacteriota bacterium]